MTETVMVCFFLVRAKLRIKSFPSPGVGDGKFCGVELGEAFFTKKKLGENWERMA